MISCKDFVEIEKVNIRNNMRNGCVLDIFQVGDNQASNAYIRGKIKDCEEVGITAKLHKFDESVEQEDLMWSIGEASLSGSSGIILQLPVPDHIDPIRAIRECIKPEQDVDGFVYDKHYPCTPKGIIDWLDYNRVPIEGKNVVIIGRSDIVGKPLAKMMTDRNATVTLCHSKTSEVNIKEFCEIADIVVVAVGKAKWFSFDLHNTPLIIDVGINRDENNKMCGDVDREHMEQQGCYVTPVPGGVGLLTRVALLKNVALQK